MTLLPNDYLHLVNCPEVVIISDKHCSVKSFLPGFRNGWLKYCARVNFGVGSGTFWELLSELKSNVFTQLSTWNVASRILQHCCRKRCWFPPLRNKFKCRNPGMAQLETWKCWNRNRTLMGHSCLSAHHEIFFSNGHIPVWLRTANVNDA